jgi:hypothetical protein
MLEEYIWRPPVVNWRPLRVIRRPLPIGLVLVLQPSYCRGAVCARLRHFY